MLKIMLKHSFSINAKQISEKKKFPFQSIFTCELNSFLLKRKDSSVEKELILGYSLQGNYSLQQRQFWNFHENLLPLFHWS